MSKATAGLLGSSTLIASAAGGIIFGIVADRYGRRFALMGSILIYSVFTAACGLARSVYDLGVYRVLLGLGMGGEWASGAALVSETWPAQHRGKALGIVQSSWAIGFAGAAIVTWLVLPRFGWRAVFFVGIIPALFTLWIQRRVQEPAIWTQSKASRAPSAGFKGMFAPGLARLTIAVTIMNAFTLFAWWGFNLWLPGYLSLPVAEGGIGLSTSVMSGFVVAMQVGMWFGYVSFGYIADAIGRKPAYVTFVTMAALLLPLYGALREPWMLLLLGPAVAFFGTGYYSGFGAVIAELYPTSIRATAAGVGYNVGRIASAAAPFVVGSMAGTSGFGAAFAVAGAAFLGAALMWIGIPATGNKELRA